MADDGILQDTEKRREFKVAGRPSLKFRNKLKDLRRERGWTQLYVARELGIPRGTYSAMESGTVYPKDTIAMRLQELFGTPFGDIFPDE
jgi:putative transcriptional regulator